MGKNTHHIGSFKSALKPSGPNDSYTGFNEGALMCQEQRVADQAKLGETLTSAKDTPLSSDSKKATSRELESILDSIQRINRLEKP